MPSEPLSPQAPAAPMGPSAVDGVLAVLAGLVSSVLGVLLLRVLDDYAFLQDWTEALGVPVTLEIIAPIGVVFGLIGGAFFYWRLRQGALWGVAFLCLAPVAFALAMTFVYRHVFLNAYSSDAVKSAYLGYLLSWIGGAKLLLVSALANYRRVRGGFLVAAVLLFPLGGAAAGYWIGDVIQRALSGVAGSQELAAASLPLLLWQSGFLLLYTFSFRRPTR